MLFLKPIYSRPILKDLCKYQKGYKVEKTIQPNQYAIDGHLLYKDLPDSSTVEVAVKYLN